MKPIIKWPGGKSREFERVRAFLPPFTRWVEPFVGGGAFFFRLEPAEALLNDAEEDLIDLYRAVQRGDGDLEDVLGLMATDRESLASRAARGNRGFADLVLRARGGEEASIGVSLALVERPGDRSLLLAVEGLAEILAASVSSKAGRLLGLEQKHGKVFAPEELPPHFETALQAGYYTAIRDRFEPGSRAESLGRFFFLRQLCYGSMFRYSGDGHFNIPYGGISYNRVDLRAKVTRLFSPGVRDLFARAEFSREDFADHLRRVRDRLDPDAFVFLDPPYDTEFSNYANRTFGKEDHDRLAAVFADLPCPALLVIQESEYIAWLYEGVGRARKERGRPFFLRAYGKTYGYNVRGRNERRARHLLVGNYPLKKGL